MTVTSTSRLGLTRWSTGSDEFTRAQMDTSHRNLETLAAGFFSDTPESAATVGEGFFNYTSTGVLEYSDGSNWNIISGGPATSVTSVSLTTATGNSLLYARADHVHNLADGAVTTDKIADGDVTNAKLASTGLDASKLTVGTLSMDRIAPLAVSNAKLASDIDGAKIVDGTITSAKISGVIASVDGGTGVNNGGRTITLNTGNLTLVADAAGSSVTVPASGTLATTANITSHSGASTGVHGVTGAVVGTTDTQTLTNKTLVTPTLTLKIGTGSATEGAIQWDGTADKIKIGDGSGIKTFSSDSVNASTYQPLNSVLTNTTASFTTTLKEKLDLIENGATADQTAADIRALGFFDVTNHGTGSGFDADMLDGQHASAFESAGTAASAVAAHSSATTSVHGIADTSALLDNADIGVTVQAYSAILDGTTASFTSTDESNLDTLWAEFPNFGRDTQILYYMS